MVAVPVHQVIPVTSVIPPQLFKYLRIIKENGIHLALLGFYVLFSITIASPQIYTRRPVKVKVVTVPRNGQPPLGMAASRP